MNDHADNNEPERLLVEGSDGISIPLFRRSVLGDSQDPVVLVVPALGVKASYYFTLLDELARAGRTAYVMELRGNGDAGPKPSHRFDFGFAEIAYSDLPAAVREIRGRENGRPVTLVGHSLGGQVSLLCAARDSSPFDSIVLVAASLPYFKAYGGRAPLLYIAPYVFLPISAVLGYFPGRTFGFATHEARTLIRQWTRLTRGSSFDGVGLSGADAELAALDLDVVCVALRGDDFAPRPAIDRLLSLIPNAKITQRLIHPSEVGLTKPDHFAWAKHPQRIVDVVLAEG